MRKNNTYPVLVAMLLTVALTGCRQESLPEAGDAIRFSVNPTVSVATETKAGKPDNPGYSTIALYGSASTWTDLMFNGKIISNDGSYSPIMYWEQGAAYEFRAAYPSQANITGGSTTDSSVPPSASSFVVTYNSLLENTTDKYYGNYDLMVATKQYSSTSRPTADTDKKVPLAFHHACAAVRFIFTKSGNDAALTCTIKGLKLNNVVTSGKLEYNSTVADAAVALTDWKNPTVDTNGWSLYDGSGWTVPDGSTSPWYFVVPQTLNGPSLEYKYVFGPDEEKTVTLTIPDKDGGNNLKWEPGYAYVYTIDIAMSKVSVQIEPWDVYSVWVTDIPFPEK